MEEGRDKTLFLRISIQSTAGYEVFGLKYPLIPVYLTTDISNVIDTMSNRCEWLNYDSNININIPPQRRPEIILPGS